MPHNHSHHHQDETSKNLMLAFILNASFVVIEIIVGLLSGSITILSDAVHDSGDSFAIIAAIFFNKFSKNKATDTHPFGFKKLKIIGALFTSIILIIGSIFVLKLSINRFFNPIEIKYGYMIGIAIVGIFVNGVSVLRLKKSNHLLDRSVMLHLLEDLLGFIGVLISGFLIYMTGFDIIDPITSIIISSFILYSAIRNLIRICSNILIKTPDDVDLEKIKQVIGKYTEQHKFEIKVWSADDVHNILVIDTEEMIQFTELKEELSELNIHDIYLRQ